MVRKLQEARVRVHDRAPDHDMAKNNTATRPPVGLDGTISRLRAVVFLSNFRRCPTLGAPVSFYLRVFILNLDSYVEIDDLQIEIAITNKIVRLDISMRDVVFVKKCESLDEAPTESYTTTGTVFTQEPLFGN